MFETELNPYSGLQSIRGMRMILQREVKLVPIKEMTDVLSVEKKSVDIDQDTWVRVKNGVYKGDLAKVLFRCIAYSRFH